MRMGISQWSGCLTAGLLAIATTAGTAQAVPLLIDDFETFSDGQNIGGNNDWVTSGGTSPQFVAATDPLDSNNMTLAATGASRGVLKPALIPDGQSELLHLRFMLQGNAHVTFGMTNEDEQGGFGQNALIGATLRIANTNLLVGTDGASTNISNLQTNQWYTLIMDIDNDNELFSGTIQGGIYGSPEQILANGNQWFDFRDIGPGIDLDLFGIRGNNNNPNSVPQAMLFDDIWLGLPPVVDDDNGDAVIPEPASMALIGLGGVLLLGRRRRGV